MIKLKGIVPVLIGMLIFNACESKKEKKEEKKDASKADLKDLDQKLEGIISAKDLI